MIEEEIIEIKDWYVLNVTPEEFFDIVETMTDEECKRFAQKKDTVRWNIPKTKCLVHLYYGEVPSVLEDVEPNSHREIKEIIKEKEWAGETPEEIIEIN